MSYGVCKCQLVKSKKGQSTLGRRETNSTPYIAAHHLGSEKLLPNQSKFCNKLCPNSTQISWQQELGKLDRHLRQELKTTSTLDTLIMNVWLVQWMSNNSSPPPPIFPFLTGFAPSCLPEGYLKCTDVCLLPSIWCYAYGFWTSAIVSPHCSFRTLVEGF